MSDHKRITFNLNLEADPDPWVWVTKKADWIRFSSLMGERSQGFRPHRFWTFNTLDREVRLFHNDLRSCISRVCPRIKVRKRPKNPWWSDDLSSQRREVRRLQQRHMKNKTDHETWCLYKTARNKFCSAIRKAKRQSWKSFTENAQSVEDVMKVSKAILQQRTPRLGHLLKPDGSYTQTKGEILDTLLDAFFPDSEEFREPCDPPLDRVLDHEISNLFTPEKLEMAFKSFKKEKAPGPDGIRPVVLQNLDGASLGRLALLYNVSLTLGYVPRRWRGAKAVLIPKAGKKDYSSPRSFRPISLTPFLFKGMERVAAWHLEEVGVVDRLSPHQHAFRKGKSTDTCLSEVVDIIEAAILRKQMALGVFFDIEGAFDNVLTSKVLEGLEAKGVPRVIIRWYGQYLSTRFVQVSLGKVTRCRSLTRGTPQGGILSPLVWNIVFDGLLGVLAGVPGVRPVGYADDGMFLVTGICPNTIFNKAQSAINKAVEWGKGNGLMFSPKKTQVILFKRKYLKMESNLHINGSRIPLSKEVSYLGLTLTERLNWNPHITQKVNKCKGKLCMLRAALGVKWGPPPGLLLWAFRSLIVPSLTYGAVVWAQSALNNSTLAKMGQLNRLAAVITSYIRKSTPTAGLEVILGLKPPDLVARELGLLCSLRTRPKTIWDGLGQNRTRGHVWTWWKWGSELGLSNVDTERTGLRHFNWDPPCLKVQYFDENEGYIICTVQVRHLGETVRFHTTLCGGSLMGLVTHRCIVKGQSPYNIFKGLEAIFGVLGRMTTGGDRVVVLLDRCPASLFRPVVQDSKTKSLLQIMTGLVNRMGNKILLSDNKDLLDRYMPRSEGEGVKWEEIPTLLASQSRLKTREVVQRWGNGKWQRRWSLLSTCQQTKDWFPVLREDVSPLIRRLSRRELSLLIHFTTGHNHLLRHERKLTGGMISVVCVGLERRMPGTSGKTV